MTCSPVRHWRSVSSPTVAPFLTREYAWWESALGWRLSDDWVGVEPARQAGVLPGWVAHDPQTGAGRGWCFAVDRGTRRLVGALVADRADVTAGLIDALLEPPCPPDVIAFTRVSAPSDAALWRARGFAVQPYHYLVASAESVAAERPPGWTSADLLDTAALLQDAYAADGSLRPFAPSGTLPEWLEYLTGLIGGPGCGTFAPAASFGLRQGPRLVGVALTTVVGPAMAHLAQVAVAPAAQGAGAARALIAAVRAVSRDTLGCRAVSLLVSAANTKACGLYRRTGFTPRAEFITARRTLRTPPHS